MSDLLHDGQPFRVVDCPRLGLDYLTLRRALRDGRVRRVVYRVYVDACVPESRWLRTSAAAMVAPLHAVICDEFASWVFGVDTFRPSERHTIVPTMVVPHGRHRVLTNGVSCRHANIPAADIMEIDGLRVTTPVRTASDLLRKLWRPYALAAADGMAHAGLVDAQEVCRYVHRLRGYPNIVQGRQLALLIEPGAESPGETWQRLRIIDAGFPRPVVQHHVVDPFGRDRYLDLAYPELLIAIEYDGREFHTAEPHQLHDAERRGLMEEALGWRFVLSRREGLFGDDCTFEHGLGALLGQVPRPRAW